MITKLKYGNTNTFLLQGEKGSILVDTDFAGTLSMFYKAIKEKGKDSTHLEAMTIVNIYVPKKIYI